MKITAIHLENVGPFRRTNWSLDPSRGFHLLVGPNEAGKSTVLRALGDALFGYPRTPPDGEFFQPYRDRRVGLTLASDDGGELSFLRRKATSQSLRALDDTAVVAEALLQKQLGSVDRARFERFFGLDHASLVKGGLELLGSEGDVGAILFAGSQLRGAPQVLAQLEQEAAKLFSPRAQIPRLNSHLKEHAELVSTMNQLMVKPQAWRTIKQEFDAAQAELEELGGQLKVVDTRCHQLLRLNAACVPARELRHIQNQLETFESIPPLDEAFFEKVAEVMEQHRRATEERALRLAEQQQLAASAADFPTVDPVWLDLDEALAELVATRGSILKARKDALKVREDLREQQAKLAAASQLLKTSDSSQLPALSKKIRKQLETLQSARTVLRERHSALAQRTAQLADEHTRLSLAPSFDKEALTSELLAHQARLTELSALVTREGEATSWTTERSSLEKSLRQLFKRLEGLLRVPAAGEKIDLSAAWEHLAALPLPSLETIEAHRQELDTLQGTTRQQTAALEQIETDLARATQERQSLLDLVLNTTSEDLAAARALRDDLWSQVRQAVAAPVPKELAEELTRAIARADELADTLFTHAANVHKDLELQLRIEQLTSEKRLQEDRLARATEAEALALSRWAAAWSPAGISPQSPRDMLGWRKTVTEALALGERHSQLGDKLAAFEERRRSFLGEWQARFPATAEPSLAACQSRLAHEIQSLTEKIRAAELQALERQRLAVDQESARLAGRELATADETWEASWAEACRLAGWNEIPAPEELAELFEQYRIIEQTRPAIENLEARLAGMHSDEDLFTREVHALATKCDPDLPAGAIESTPAVDLLPQLVKRSKEARTRFEEQERHRARAAQLTAELQRLQQGIDTTAAQLADLCTQAGIPDLKELPALREKCRQRRELALDLRKQESELARQSGTGSVETLIQEALAVDPDTLPPAIDELQKAVQQLRERERQATARHEQARVALAQMSGESQAALLNEEASDLRRAIVQESREYLRLSASAELLRTAIKAYREQHQGPVLSMASSLFVRLTGQVFSGLKVDVDDSRPRLVVSRHDGGTLEVSALSTGTADQLFLAIRLAWIEEYLTQHAPFPVILDDVLVQFDDERTRHTLEVLGELSRKTQILCFTHHEHLKNLVTAALDSDQYQIHPLNRLRSAPMAL